MILSSNLYTARILGSELLKKYVFMPGSHDCKFRPVIFFPDLGYNSLPEKLHNILFYFFNNCIPNSNERHHVVVIDRRRSTWASVKRIVFYLNSLFSEFILCLYILRPQGILHRLFSERIVFALQTECRIPISFLDNPEDLFQCISWVHMPSDLDGGLVFDITLWLNFQIGIEDFLAASTSVGKQIQNFAEDLDKRGSPGRIAESAHTLPTSPDYRLEYFPHLVTTFNRQRRRLLRALNGCEANGLELRKRLRDLGDLAVTIEECRPVMKEPHYVSIASANGSLNPASPSLDATVQTSSLDLPIDRATQIIAVEQILVQLMETRSCFHRFWAKFSQNLKIWQNLDNFEKRYRELEPLLGMWESLIESVSDYLPGRSSAPLLPLALYLGGVQGLEEDSAGLVEGSEDSSPGGSSLEEAIDPLESVLATQSRVSEAQSMGAGLLDQLRGLMRVARRMLETFTPGEEADELSQETSLLLACLNIWGDDVTEQSPGLSTTDSSSCGDDRRPKWTPQYTEATPTPASPTSDMRCLIETLPHYIDSRLRRLQRLEELAQDCLPKALSQLNRLTQLYSEVNEARNWILNGQKLLAQFNLPNAITAMDLSSCENALVQLNSLSNSRQFNLVLRGDPRQFRRQFSDLINNEMRIELIQMLRLLEEVDSSLARTTAALQQHISRSAFPRLPLPVATASEAPTRRQDETSSGIPVINATTLETNQNKESRYKLALQELIATEKSHVKFLQSVYDSFWVGIEEPPDDCPPPPPVTREDIHFLLVNWPDQLTFHRDQFLPQLIACDGEPERLKQWAENSRSGLVDIYTTYCMNYEKAMQLAYAMEQDSVFTVWMANRNVRLHCLETGSSPTDGMQPRSESPFAIPDSVEASPEQQEPVASPQALHRKVITIKSSSLARPLLPFSAKLVSPAQRFQRYHLLIDRLRGYSSNEKDKEALSLAHESMLDICNTVNALMRIRGLKGRPSRLGRLLLQDNFTVWRDDERLSNHQRHVFLFENSILLTKFRASGSVLSGPNAPAISLAQSEVGATAAASTSVSAIIAAWNASDSMPVYDIKLELSLGQIGLTPTIREDRRRFALWTASRAQTFVFQSVSAPTRSVWVRAINGLLSVQLKRLRDEVLRKHNCLNDKTN